MNLTLNESVNTTRIYFGECTTSLYPKRLYSDAFSWSVIIIYSIILVFGLIGNMLTCMVVFIHKSMRRSIHCYMLNLAIADIIILLVYIPTQSVLVYNQLEWSLGMNACSFITFVIPTFLSGSIATLMAISIDRYSGVRDPFTWRVKSRRNSKIIIPVIWVMSLSFAVPYYIFGGLQHSTGDGCKCIWPTSRFKISYITSMMAIQFIFPFVLIACVYLHIVWILARSTESINRLHKRMIKMVIFLLFTYLVCVGMQYFDFYYQLVLINSGSTNGPYIYVITNLLLTVQAAINPLIYSSTRDDFHLAFKTIIVNCHYKITNFLLDDRYMDIADFRSETDTERWFNINTGRRGSSASRKKSVESMTGRKISLTEFTSRKPSIISLRKPSVHSMRRKSSIRAPPLPFIIDSDSIGSCSDYEEGEEPTLRSYRLGTLEFIELEEFHKKMKDNIRKESRVRKISRTFRNFVFHPDAPVSGSERTTMSLDDEENDFSEKTDKNENKRHSSNSKSGDSVSTSNSLQSIDESTILKHSSSDGLVMKLDNRKKYSHTNGITFSFYDKNDIHEPTDLKSHNIISDQTVNRSRKISTDSYKQDEHIPVSEKKRSRKSAITDSGIRIIPKVRRKSEHSYQNNACNSVPSRRKLSACDRSSNQRKLSSSLENVTYVSRPPLVRTSSHGSVPGKSVLKSADHEKNTKTRKVSKSIRWEDTEIKETVTNLLSDIVNSLEILSNEGIYNDVPKSGDNSRPVTPTRKVSFHRQFSQYRLSYVDENDNLLPLDTGRQREIHNVSKNIQRDANDTTVTCHCEHVVGEKRKEIYDTIEQHRRTTCPGISPLKSTVFSSAGTLDSLHNFTPNGGDNSNPHRRDNMNFEIRDNSLEIKRLFEAQESQV